MATGFPYSRTIVTIQSHRTEKKSGRYTVDTRYYLSSQEAHERTQEDWINLTRSHWAVENRNHWRRDASLGEDRTRMRNGNALVNLALVRSVNLKLLTTMGEDWTPAKKERLAADPEAALRLVSTK